MQALNAGSDNGLEELRQVESILDGAFANHAKRFVDAGDELIEAVGAFRRLSEVFDDLQAALSSDALSAGTETLASVATDCAAIHDLIPSQLGSLDELFDANRDIGKRLDQLQDKIDFVACIAMNARIEASALKSNSGDMFTFTYEVANLAKRANETIKLYSDEQQKAQAVLRDAGEVLSDFSKRHRAQIGRISTDVEANLHAVEIRRSEVLEEASVISGRSREITASIGKIISALQISDITSQRLAHVHEAVSLLIEGLSSETGAPGEHWWAELTTEERWHVAARVARLQISQIDHAVKDLDAETASIETEIAKLSHDAGHMAQQGAALYGAGGDAAKSFLGELADRIELAKRLLAGCRDAFTNVGELNQEVGARFNSLHEQAASLQGVVGIVSAVRLIGLNAHLKSDGLGLEGRTLSAISRELRTSADQISVHARDLVKAINLTLSRFESLTAREDVVGPTRVNILIAGIQQAVSAFGSGGQQIADALATLAREGGRVRKNLESSGGHIVLRDDLDDRLSIARDILLRIGDIGNEKDGSPRSESVFTSFFADRYTMAAERNVHLAQQGEVAWDTEPGGSSIMQTADDELDCILF